MILIIPMVTQSDQLFLQCLSSLYSNATSTAICKSVENWSALITDVQDHIVHRRSNLNATRWLAGRKVFFSFIPVRSKTKRICWGYAPSQRRRNWKNMQMVFVPWLVYISFFSNSPDLKSYLSCRPFFSLFPLIQHFSTIIAIGPIFLHQPHTVTNILHSPMFQYACHAKKRVLRYLI